MTNKSKNIFDFCIGTVISLINKMSCELGQEELIIKLALDIIENNKLIKSENYFQISKKFNIDEENLLKIINKKDTIENLNKIFFILETIEKKTIPNKTNLNYTINSFSTNGMKFVISRRSDTAETVQYTPISPQEFILNIVFFVLYFL